MVANNSSVIGKIFVSFFVMVVFPTVLILVQRQLSIKGLAEEHDGDQKQKVEVIINTHYPPGLSPVPPSSSPGGSPEKEPPAPKVPPPLLPPLNLSGNLTGTWSGAWVDSGGGHANQGMLVREQPQGILVGGWCNGFKIQNGRRVGQSGILFESDGGSYQVAGQVNKQGDRLLLLYTYTEAKPGSAVVGIHRLNRNGVEASPEPKVSGWEGKWSGVYANSLGSVGSKSVVIKDLQDGTFSGVWDDDSITTARVTGNGLARWNKTQKDTGLYQAELHLEGDLLRTSYTCTYPPGSRRKGFKGVEWFVRGELPATPAKIVDGPTSRNPTPVIEGLAPK